MNDRMLIDPIASDSTARPLSVCWLGSSTDPRLVDAAGLDGVDLSLVDGAFASGIDGTADVVHIATSHVRIADVRRACPEAAVVLDWRTGRPHTFGRRLIREARAADLILLGTLSALRAFRARHTDLRDSTALVHVPIDLDHHAPIERLQAERDAALKRFRRFHRLAGPMILYAGPYDEAGGLDLAVEAAFRLRERIPSLRIAAVPDGRIDRRCLDRCERRALGLGHKAILEWSSVPDEIPFWYALAAVVCLPCREAVSSGAASLAGAAARPFVGSDVEPLREVVVDGETGFLTPPGDLDALTAGLEALLSDQDEAARIGRAARLRVESHVSPTAVTRQLQRAWAEACRAQRDLPVGGVDGGDR